jgi:predicted PurR-regulated permease PerM
MSDGTPDRRRLGTNSLLSAFLIVAALYFAREVFIPLALAGLISFLLAPVATRLERWGLHRTVAGLLVIVIAFTSVSTIGYFVLGQVYNLAVELPQYQQNVTRKIDTLHLHSTGKLTSTVQMLSEVEQRISKGEPEPSAATVPLGPSGRKRTAPAHVPLPPDAAPKPNDPVAVKIEAPDTSVLAVLARKIEPLVHPLTTAFAVFIFVIFMLLSRDDLRERAVRLVGSSRIHITTVAMTDAGTRVSRYLFMQFMVNVGYGAVVGVGLWAIGVPHPLLWAVTTGLLRFIPYVGILAAGSGPVLIALAASPSWSPVAWAFGLYLVLELLAANLLEPMLYGSSTGVSAMAILIAAIFWTWLWGIAGLLLSTPLTVCLIVIGRHVPSLAFIGVLFGEEAVLDPPQRLYQRVLASDSKDIARLLEDEMKTRSREELFDTVLIPTLSLIEEARHSDELPENRAEHALQCIEEQIEEHWNVSSEPSPQSREQIMCVSVRDLADDIACQMLSYVVNELYDVQVLSADLPSAEVVSSIASTRPRVICVVGVPPQAIRHVRLRCHQLRRQFPDTIIAACVFSSKCDLSSIRGRISLQIAQHVVCSLQQAKDYLSSLRGSETITSTDSLLLSDTKAISDEEIDSHPLDETSKEIFDQIVGRLARTFEAPIAIINVFGTSDISWKSQRGLSEDEMSSGLAMQDSLLCRPSTLQGQCMVVPDVAEDDRFRGDPVMVAKNIRFFAGAPIFGQRGDEIGSLCVMDTRSREVTERQIDCLKALAESVMNAIDLRSNVPEPGGSNMGDEDPNQAFISSSAQG